MFVQFWSIPLSRVTKYVPVVYTCIGLSQRYKWHGAMYLRWDSKRKCQEAHPSLPWARCSVTWLRIADVAACSEWAHGRLDAMVGWKTPSYYIRRVCWPPSSLAGELTRIAAYYIIFDIFKTFAFKKIFQSSELKNKLELRCSRSATRREAVCNQRREMQPFQSPLGGDKGYFNPLRNPVHAPRIVACVRMDNGNKHTILLNQTIRLFVSLLFLSVCISCILAASLACLHTSKNMFCFSSSARFFRYDQSVFICSFFTLQQ